MSSLCPDSGDGVGAEPAAQDALKNLSCMLAVELVKNGTMGVNCDMVGCVIALKLSRLVRLICFR